MEAKGEMQEPKGVDLLNPPFARDFLLPEPHETVVRVAQVAVPGQSGCDSTDFTQEAGPVDVLNAFSRFTVRGRRPSSLLLHWSHRLMAWTMALQSLAVPNSSFDGRRYQVMSSDTVASEAFAVSVEKSHPLHCRERVTGDPEDDGPKDIAGGYDADNVVEGPHCLVPILQDEPSPSCFMWNGRSPDGPAADRDRWDSCEGD